MTTLLPSSDRSHHRFLVFVEISERVRERSTARESVLNPSTLESSYIPVLLSWLSYNEVIHSRTKNSYEGERTSPLLMSQSSEICHLFLISQVESMSLVEPSRPLVSVFPLEMHR